jgi:hypothetical protein
MTGRPGRKLPTGLSESERSIPWELGAAAGGGMRGRRRNAPAIGGSSGPLIGW